MSTEHNLGVSFEIFHQGWYLLFCKAITFISSLHECRLLLTDKNTTVCLEEQKISCIIQIMHSNIAWLKAKTFRKPVKIQSIRIKIICCQYAMTEELRLSIVLHASLVLVMAALDDNIHNSNTASSCLGQNVKIWFLKMYLKKSKCAYLHIVNSTLHKFGP